MTHGSMRKLLTPSSSSLRCWKNFLLNPQRIIVKDTPILFSRQILPARGLAQVRPEPLSELWFTPSSPVRSPADDLPGGSPQGGNGKDHKPPDERTLKLGKTLRTLSPLLPNILTAPLPPEILSPSISLHLFPSTHPHLPAVKGKIAYKAALWTAPVAWGCVPIVGNVKLQVVSERIVRTGFIPTPHHDDDRSGLGEEKLVVRWKTEKKIGNNDGSSKNAAPASSSTTGSSANGNGGINRGLSILLGGDKPIFNLNKGDDFSGLFIFSFDSEGRIATHTIEHADESKGFDKTSKVVTLTDWLLGKARWGRGREEELIPGLAMRVCRQEWAKNQILPRGHPRSLHSR